MLSLVISLVFKSAVPGVSGLIPGFQVYWLCCLCWSLWFFKPSGGFGISSCLLANGGLFLVQVSFLVVSLVFSLVFKSGVYAPSGDLSGFQVWFLWCLWSHPWFSRLLVMLSLLVSTVFKSGFFGVSGLIPGFSSLLVLLSLLVSLVFKSGFFGVSVLIPGFQVYWLCCLCWCLWFFKSSGVFGLSSGLLANNVSLGLVSLVLSLVFKSGVSGVSGLIPGFSSLLLLFGTSLSGSGLFGAVSAASSLVFGVYAAVSGALSLLFGVYAAVSSASSLVFGVYAAVSGTLSLVFGVYAAVSSASSLVFGVYAAVSSASSLVFGVYAAVSGTLSLVFGVYAAVSSASSLVFGVYAAVSSASSLVFGVYAAVSGALSQVFGVYAAVFSASSLMISGF
ncbi:unnamed protein product [Mucor circinelloides]